MKTEQLIDTIKKYQGRKGISNGAFAKTIGVDPSLISRILAGTRDLSDGVIVKIGRAYPDLRGIVTLTLFSK